MPMSTPKIVSRLAPGAGYEFLATGYPMRRLAALAIAAAALLLPAQAGYGALEPRGGKATSTPFELVVFEANGCIYCEVFRSDVLPLYKGSAAASRPRCASSI